MRISRIRCLMVKKKLFRIGEGEGEGFLIYLCERCFTYRAPMIEAKQATLEE